MVGITETQSWQRAFRLMANRSRWDLAEEDVERQMAAAFQLIMETLAGNGDARARRFDPSGEISLGLAKRMRLDVMRNRIPGDRRLLTELADENFGLPRMELSFWATSASQPPWRSPAPNGGRSPGTS